MPFGKKADEEDDFVEPISKKKIKTYDEQRRETKEKKTQPKDMRSETKETHHEG